MKRLLAPFLLLAVVSALLISSPGAQAGPPADEAVNAAPALVNTAAAPVNELAPGAPVLDVTGQPIFLAQNEADASQPPAATGGTTTPAPTAAKPAEPAKTWYDTLVELLGNLSAAALSLSALIGLITRLFGVKEQTRAEKAVATFGLDVGKLVRWLLGILAKVFTAKAEDSKPSS